MGAIIQISANYHKVWFDGLNNFYLRQEDIGLCHAFRLPSNIFDRFETAEVVRLRNKADALKNEIAEFKKQIDVLFSRRRICWMTRFANWPELKKLAEPSKKPGAETQSS